MSTYKGVTPLTDSSIVHTNHCLSEMTRAVERDREAESLARSQKRLDLGYAHLQETPVTVEALMQMTRADHPPHSVPMGQCSRESPLIQVFTQ